MKKIVVLCTVIVAAALFVGASRNAQPALEETLLVDTDDALDVMKTVQTLAQDIRTERDYPTSDQDASAAGLIFQSFEPVINAYNALREKDPQSAQTVGAYMAQFKFITRDGKMFEIESFLQEYIATVQDQRFKNQLEEFKDHLHQDAEAEK